MTSNSIAVQRYSTGIDPIDGLLGRLDKVHSKGSGQWVALCPAHNDKTPSLSIKVTDDGTILVKCWSGCGALDIVQAVGLELKDLFPVQTAHHHKRRPYNQRLNVNYRDLLKRLHGDLTIIDLYITDVKHTDLKTIIGATGRVRKILEAANV